MQRHGARSSSRSMLRSSTVGMLTTVASFLGTEMNSRMPTFSRFIEGECKVGASVTTDQACASCIRLIARLCKGEKVVVGFQMQIAGFGGSRAVASVRHRTGAFSSDSLVLSVPGRRVPASATSLHASPSGC